MSNLTDLQFRRNRILERLESLQKRVTHGDKSVEYDLTQARTALDILDREISRSGGGRKVVRHVRVRSVKDL